MAIATDRVVTSSGARDAARRVRGRALPTAGRIALVILGVLVLATVVGPLLWGPDPIAQNINERLQPPSPAHPFGTDRYGRDIFARLLTGGRWSLAGAAIVCLGTSLTGFLVGALAATGGRTVDLVLGRAIEALMALPGIVMALALTTILPASFATLLFALIITGWPPYARIYRALLLREREAGYVEAAICAGCGRRHVLIRHLLPNIVGPALVLATGNFGGVILSLASLSFLGFGIQAPTPEWGVLINEARAYFQTQPWQMVAPGLGIALTVLAVNLLGDALRDRWDPRTQRR
ncbi:MAG: ABC transporter permease [Rhodospirillales bacterium]|nr:ABC transporter permease [Rhodospirillales bacterium]